MIVDVFTLPEVRPGDESVIIGVPDGARIDVGEQGAAIGTITYEILYRVGSRTERVYG